MADLWAWLQNHVTLANVVGTGVLLVAVIVCRVVLVRRLKHDDSLPFEIRRRWMAQIRTASILLLLLGVFLIWAAELKTFALSIIAIAAAIVIATKELIMCLSGTILRSISGAFSIGDRVEINAMRGDVIDQTLLTTTILETGPGNLTQQHTGRTITVPNSTFLTAPVFNESFTDDFVLHVFSVPLRQSTDWERSEELPLRCAQEECADFLDEARSHMEKLLRDQGLSTMSVEPRVTIQMPDPDRVNLLVRVPVPARRKGRIEQAILKRYIERAGPMREDASTVRDEHGSAAEPPS